MVGMDRPRRNSGVSETIGFIIIFGIVMTGIAIVTLYGYPALTQEQANANIKNMEKNMLVLQSDLKSLTFKSVPYQETTMQVSGGTLLINENPNPVWPYFTISVPGENIPSFFPGDLRYISSDGMANIALENGAVHIRYWYDSTGSAMLAEPSWFYDTTKNTYVIHLIRLNASSDFAQTGIGTVRMQILDPPEQEVIPITGKTVKISYQGNPEEDYMIAWKNYFNRPELMMENMVINGRNVTVDLPNSAEWLVIKKSNVTVISL